MIRGIKTAAIGGCSLFALLATLLIGINVIVINSTKVRISLRPQVSRSADLIVVLGARVYSKEHVCPILFDRLETALSLYESKKAGSIIVSGHSEGLYYNEPATMKRWLSKRKIPQEVIVLDESGDSTIDTLLTLKRDYSDKRIILSTQHYHLYRSLYIGRKLGLDVYGVASDRRRYIHIRKYQAREALARIKDFFLVRIYQARYF